MDLGNLKVKIGADTQELSVGLDKAGRQITQFAATATKGATKAKSDFTNLGRVIQDLPYGFNGIANNLTQLIPAVGGLGLAFSSLVTAVTFAQIGFGAWTRGMGGAKKSMDLFNEALTTGADNAGKEATNLRLLEKIATDTTAKTTERKRAVDELQKLYPEYLKNISDEAILSGKAAEAINRTSQALINKGLAQAFSEQAAKEAGNMVKAIQAQKKATEDLSKANAALSKADASKADAELRGLQQFNAIADRADALNAQKDATLELNRATKNYNDLLSESAKYAKQAGDTFFDPEKGAKSVKTFTDIIKDLRKEVTGLKAEFKNGFITAVQLDQKVIDAYQKAVGLLAQIKAPPLIIKEISLEVSAEQLREQMRKFKEFIQKNFKEDPIEVPVDVVTHVNVMTDEQAKTANKLAELDKQMMIDRLKKLGKTKIKVGTLNGGITIPVDMKVSKEQLREELSKTEAELEAWRNDVRALMSDMAVSLGEGLAKAIDGGGLKSIFAGLLSTFADFITEWGKGQIQMGIAAEALKNLQLAPGANIVAGIATVAIGTLMKSQIPKFAQGGMVTGPTLAMIGDNASGREAIIPFERMAEFASLMAGGGRSGGGKQTIEVVGYVHGDSLRFIQAKSSKKYNKNS